MRAALLKNYEGPCVLTFANGESLELPAGNYWTAAFGVVIDTKAHKAITTPKSAWKVA